MDTDSQKKLQDLKMKMDQAQKTLSLAQEEYEKAKKASDEAIRSLDESVAQATVAGDEAESQILEKTIDLVAKLDNEGEGDDEPKDATPRV